MLWLNAQQITKLPMHNNFISNSPLSLCRDKLANTLRKSGYRVNINNNRLTAEWGKFSRLAPTVTHIGLLTLLAGVIWSSWTGFSGFKTAVPGEVFTLNDAEHSHLWLGKLPDWSIRVGQTHREDYASGEAKQWYSNLSVIDKDGKVLEKQTISVNNPLSYCGVDIYQSSWGLKSLKIRFNNDAKELDLQPMGKLFAAFLPLPHQSIIIFSVRDAQSPLRVFAKREDWSSPKFLTQIPISKSTNLGTVAISYDGIIPQTGLQYKCDPGFPVVFLAFIFIIGGISLAAIPHRQIWAQFDKVSSNKDLSNKDPINSSNPSISPDNTLVTIGGATKKSKISFAREISKLSAKIQT